jgi:hypothetical protein
MATALSSWLDSRARQDWTEACNYTGVDHGEQAPSSPEVEAAPPKKKGMERAMQVKAVLTMQASKISKRDRVVLEHLPLVKAIAVRVYENLPVHVDLDDLVHAGILGLFDGAT